MDKMAMLARDVRVLEEKLAVCTKCGSCQAFCPLFAETRRESDVSRGKVALIRGLVDGLFKDAKGVNERLHRCLLCGSCAKACPSSVNALEIFISARAIIARYLGLSFSEKLVFKRLLADPGTFNRFSDLAARFQWLFFKTRENIQGTSCARAASPLLRHRHVVPLKKQAIHTHLEETGREIMDFRQGGKGVRVAFFIGCLIDKAFPNIAFSALDVLKHNKAWVFIPKNQGCCGIPALAAGDMDTFTHLVRQHVDLFSEQKWDYLVTACATCTSTIIKLWPSLTTDRTLLPRLEALAEKTVDINWLLARRFGLSMPESGAEEDLARVTYHDPCHLKKSLDVHEEPRMVLQAAGYHLAEMADSDTCCGMGGSFNLKHYELSKTVGSKKAENIIDTKCHTVATSCPACMMQLSDMLAQKQADVKVCHPVELLAKSLNQ